MQIEGIYIKRFLSFDGFDWSDINSRLNIIVGPNGVGKTNLLHAVRAVMDALNPNQRKRTLLWTESAYRGTNTRSIEISLDIQITGEWEQKLLLAFFSSALCNDQAFQSAIVNLQNAGNTPPANQAAEQERFSLFLQEKLHPQDISWMFKGRLTASYDGLNNWNVWYGSRSESSSFRLNLSGLFPQNDTLLNHFVQDILAKQEFSEPSLRLLLSFFPSALRGQAWRVERPATVALATHQTFERLTGIAFTSGQPFDARFVFQLLLERAFVFSDNTRSKLLYEFSHEDFNQQSIDLSNGEQLPRFLFLKKNGTFSEREQYKVIQQMFCKITGRSFDVGFGDLNPPTQIMLTSPKTTKLDQPNVVLEIHISSDWGDVPLEFSGAGLAEALFLSALLTSGDRRILLLDEPALNLHPTMQSTLLDQIQAYTENQIQCIFVTHSPALLRADAITKVSRFFMSRGSTQRASLSSKEVNEKQITRLGQELRRSIDSRALLFSRGVMLVEGDTEVGALPIWFEKHFSYPLESRDITVYCVGGDKGFRTLVEFLHQFAIPWAIICDGKVIGDRIASQEQSRIVRQLVDAGITNLPDTNGKDFSHLCQVLEMCGVFTLAKEVDDEFEALSIVQLHQKEAEDQVGGKSKVRIGRYIAGKYECPTEVGDLLDKVMKYLRRFEQNNGNSHQDMEKK